jgi:hypothetical protein
MSKERLAKADTEMLVESEKGTPQTLRLRWAGWLLEQLDRRGMLVQGAPRPESWSRQEVIAVTEFSQWLRKHLNVGGWRVVMAQVQAHNTSDPEHPWELATPHDLLDAIEQTLRQDVSVKLAPMVAPGDIVAELQEQDNTLKSLKTLLAARPAEMEMLSLPPSAWLLAPRAVAAVVRAQAISAKAAAELERARSESLLHALRIMETNLRSSAMLAQIQELRTRLGPHLATYCQEHSIPVPAQGSEEEANMLFLLNAQLSAMNDAQEEIARRGAELARDQIGMAEKSAKASIEARALPLQLETESSANPYREKLLREQLRHRSAEWSSRLVGTVGGVISGFCSSAIDMATAGIAETAWISAPPLAIVLLTLVAETLSYEGQLTAAKIAGFVGIALWNGLLMLGFTLTAYAFWRHLTNRFPDQRTLGARRQPIEHEKGQEL